MQHFQTQPIKTGCCYVSGVDKFMILLLCKMEDADT